MNWLRRGFLELWAMMLASAVVGFLGPFGSYLAGSFIVRFSQWSMMLMGAYVMVRPTIAACHWLARKTHLPRGLVVSWGTVAIGLAMAAFWLRQAPKQTELLGGYAGLAPFSLLNAWLVVAVVWWAERTDAWLRHVYRGDGSLLPDPLPANPASVSPGLLEHTQARLRLRLSRGFTGPILALESEDHYVRVHGEGRSELLLIRLRDAIAELDGCPGEQTHRSWWVARAAVAESRSTGRGRTIRLVNGMDVPVARDSVARLVQSGFLPG